jgi:hypothetical protein
VDLRDATADLRVSIEINERRRLPRSARLKNAEIEQEDRETGSRRRADASRPQTGAREAFEKADFLSPCLPVQSLLFPAAARLRFEMRGSKEK